IDLTNPQTSRHTLFPYTTLFRSSNVGEKSGILRRRCPISWERSGILGEKKWSVVKERGMLGSKCHILGSEVVFSGRTVAFPWRRSEEHTSELQSRFDLVCRLLLE